MKFCKDCKHCMPARYFGAEKWQFAKCSFLKKEEVSSRDFMVGGVETISVEYYYCGNARRHDLCGEEARHFEPKGENDGRTGFLEKIVGFFQG